MQYNYFIRGERDIFVLGRLQSKFKKIIEAELYELWIYLNLLVCNAGPEPNRKEPIV